MLMNVPRHSFPAGDTFTPDSVAWVMDETVYDVLLQAIGTATDIVYDLETTGLDEHEPEPDPPYQVEKIGKNGRVYRRTITPTGCKARIVLAALTLPQPDDPDPLQPTTWIVPLSHPDGPNAHRWVEWMTGIALAIQTSRARFVNHNIKFDCRWTYALTGVDLSRRITWDPMLAAHLMNENTDNAKLKEVVPRLFPGVPRWDDHDLKTPGAAERVDLEELGVYAARDTYWTWRLYLLQVEAMFLNADIEGGERPFFEEEVELARLGLLMYWCNVPQCRVLTAMEQRGVLFDEAWASDMVTKLTEEAAQIEAELIGRYPQISAEGGTSWQSTSGWFKKFAEAACEAGDLKAINVTGKGAVSWSKSVLNRLAARGYDVAGDIREVRSRNTRLAYLRSWLESARRSGGKIYSNYNQGSVVTGRLSSSNPNLQQVTKSLRPAFVPSPGYVMAELDFSQIELRLAAHIANSPTMIQAYRDGLDLHRMMAQGLINKARKEAWTEWSTKLQKGESWLAEDLPMWMQDKLKESALSEDGDYTEMERYARAESEMPDKYALILEEVPEVARQSGKAANFGLLYGMSAFGFQLYAEDVYGVHFTREEAQLAYEAFFDLWQGLKEWHINVGITAQRTERVTSPIGRVRRVPDINSADPKQASGAHRVAINSPVQGFASDIMQMASACIEGVMPGVKGIEGVRLLGTVHDSIFMEVREDDWENLVERCKFYMTEVAPTLLKRMDCTLRVPLAADATVGTRWGLNDVGKPQ